MYLSLSIFGQLPHDAKCIESRVIDCSQVLAVEGIDENCVCLGFSISRHAVRNLEALVAVSHKPVSHGSSRYRGGLKTYSVVGTKARTATWFREARTGRPKTEVAAKASTEVRMTEGRILN